VEFSKAWKSAPAFFQALELFGTPISKPWNNGVFLFQALEITLLRMKSRALRGVVL
jgi:hypothetical protein